MSRIDWEKGDETIQADSIQAIVTKAILCSPQTIESLLPSIPDDALIVCKSITWSSRQSRLTHPETESFVSETESKLGNSSCLGVNEDPSLNLRCMTMSDWIEAQSKNKFIGHIIKLYKSKGLQYWKVRKLITKK